MPSKTEIANMAYAKVGQSPITDIDNSADNLARDAKLVFEDVVKEVMRSHPWNCLKTRTALSADTTGPAFEWTYQYTLPTHCLRLLTVNGYEGQYVQDVYEVEGRKILTDAEECKITYVGYTADTSKYDSLLISCIVALLAAHLALKTAKDPNLSARMRQEYEQVILPRARQIDGNEQNRRKYNMAAHSGWLRSRAYPVR